MKLNSLQPFLPDVIALRRGARAHAERGAVTAAYSGGREQVVLMLNGALATELVCMLRYRRHHAMAGGLAVGEVAAEFLAHSNEELAHADRLAARILELNGAPDFDPATLTARAHAEYIEGSTLVEMLGENLVAERIAVDSYLGMIRWLGDADPTTRRLLESILEVEERHAAEMADLLVAYTPTHAPPPLAPLRPTASPDSALRAAPDSDLHPSPDGGLNPSHEPLFRGPETTETSDGTAMPGGRVR